MRGLAVQDKVRSDRAPTMRCAVSGCEEYTREKKPVCPDHIFEEPYPLRLFKIIEGVEDEIRRVGARGHKEVDIDGIVVEEILAGLKANAELTWRRLVKDHVAFLNGVGDKVTDGYLSALKKSGLVQCRLSSRKDVIVSLTEQGYERVNV